ncbi:MAG: hypothetical protein ACTHJ0_06305 [Flavipsychrobacter sp.]
MQSEKEYDIRNDISPLVTNTVVKAAKSHTRINDKRLANRTNPPKNNKSTRKLHIAKHISLKLTIPERQDCYPTYSFACLLHQSRIRDTYHYLYSREINPPPPKC